MPRSHGRSAMTHALDDGGHRQLKDTVYLQLRDDIVNGTLPPGAVLRLAELARIVRASANCVSGGEVAPGREDELASLLDRFDLVMYAQSRNSRIDEMVGNIRGHIQRIGRLTTGIPGRLAKSVPEHQAIYEAIVQRDGAAAETLMRRHILSVMADQLTSIAEAH